MVISHSVLELLPPGENKRYQHFKNLTRLPCFMKTSLAILAWNIDRWHTVRDESLTSYKYFFVSFNPVIFYLQVYVESLWEGVDFSTTLSRARLDGLASTTLSAFLQPAKEAVQRCGLTVDNIHKVRNQCNVTVLDIGVGDVEHQSNEHHQYK